jgi:hypothetical protein
MDTPRTVQMRNFSLFGSRVLFFTLAPWLALGVVVFSALAFGAFQEGRLSGVLAAGVLTLFCLFVMLLGVSPRRFGWAMVFVTGIIATGYVWYVFAAFLDPETGPYRSDAIRGLQIMGLPCLWFTLRGISIWIHGRSKEQT